MLCRFLEAACILAQGPPRTLRRDDKKMSLFLPCRHGIPGAVVTHLSNNAGLAAPVERLVFVDEVERIQTGPFQSRSLPGHLLHLVTAGAVSQWAEGRAEVFSKGAVVWYHDDEPVRGQIVRAPWRFITINFRAPALPPPPDDRRVLRAGPATLRLGRRLLALWRNDALPPLERQLRCHRALLELLLQILPGASLHSASPLGPKVWWRIEKQLRGRLEEPLTLAAIQQLSGLSVRTIIRACKAATGVPPMRRLREIRLSYARGLVQHSDLPITEIAFRIGYARSQEFSRDYHRRFDITPREDRRQPPAYRRLEQPTDKRSPMSLKLAPNSAEGKRGPRQS